MKLIIFQKFNYNYIFFIFFLICCIVEAIIEVNNAKEQKEINKKGKGHFFQVTILILVCLSDFLALIPYFIKQYLTKNKIEATIKKDENESNLRSNFIYNNAFLEEQRKKSANLNIYTFFVGFIDFIGEALYFLYYNSFNLIFFFFNKKYKNDLFKS